MKRGLTFLLLIFAFSSWVFLCSNNKVEPTEFIDTTAVEEAVQRFLGLSGLETATIGFHVRDAQTGKEVYSYNGNKTLTPASTLKISTTAAALITLGSDFRFSTYLEYDGAIDPDGVLQGNLYIRGTGDPSLGFKRFRDNKGRKNMLTDWTTAIREAGITAINGCIVGDSGEFVSQAIPGSWPWEDIGNYYGAGTYGLNFHENQFNIQFENVPTEGEQVNVVSIEPDLGPIEVVNEVRTGPSGSGDQAYVFSAPYSSRLFIRGTIPTGNELFTIKGSITDPPLVYCFTVRS